MGLYRYASESGDRIIDRHYVDGKAPSSIKIDGRVCWRKLPEQPEYAIEWPGMKLIHKTPEEMAESKRKMAGLTYGELANKIRAGEI